jgi:hypothetical protein
VGIAETFHFSMANIAINLSSNTVNQLKGNTATDTIGDDLSLFFQADYHSAAAIRFPPVLRKPTATCA